MKKLICLSLFAFLFSTGFIVKSQAQSVSHYFTGEYWAPLICNGVQVDEVWGEITVHCIMHYKNGKLIWMIHKYSGSLTGQVSGEVFEIQETDKIDLNEDTYTFHANIRGNQNNHYILSGTGLYVEPWTVYIDKANCPSQ